MAWSIKTMQQLKTLPPEKLKKLPFESCRDIFAEHLSKSKNYDDLQITITFILNYAVNIKKINQHEMQSTFQIVIPKLDNFVCETLSSKGIQEDIQALVQVLQDLSLFCTYLTSQIDSSSVCEHSSFALDIFKLLFRIYDYKSLATNSKLSQVSLNIQNTILSFLTTGTLLKPNDARKFIQILDHLCQLPKKMTDVKNEIRVLKASNHMLKRHFSTAQKLFKPTDSVWNFLENLVGFLVKKIHENVAKHSKCTSETDSLILSGFYVNLLSNLTQTIPSDYFRGHESVLATALYLHNFGYDLKNLEIENKILLPFMKVVTRICQHKSFVEHFLELSPNTTERVFAYFSISMEIIKHILSDQSAIDPYTKLFSKLMNLLPECHTIFHKRPETAKPLVEHLAALAVVSLTRENSNVAQDVEEELVNSILQNNYWRGVVAIDLWTILGRTVDEIQNMKYFMFWTSIHKKLLSTTFQQAVFVETVLKNFFELLSPAQKSSILKDMPPNEYLQLWAVIGLNSIRPDLTNSRIHAELVQETVREMDGFLKQPNSFRNLDRLVQLLELIATQQIQSNDKFLVSFIQIWKTCSHKTFPLLHALVEVSLVYELTDEQMFKILTQVSDVKFPAKPTAVKLLQLKVAISLSQETFTQDSYKEDIFNVLTKMWIRLMTDEDKLVKSMSIQGFLQLAVSETRDKITVSIYKLNSSLKVEMKTVGQKSTAIKEQIEDFLEKQTKTRLSKVSDSISLLEDDFDDIMAEFKDDMLPVASSTQKRRPDHEPDTENKRFKLTNDANPNEIIENILTQAQLLETLKLNDGWPMTGANLDKIQRVIGLLNRIKL